MSISTPYLGRYALRCVPIPPETKCKLWVLGDASFAPIGEKSQQGLIVYHGITSENKNGGNLVQYVKRRRSTSGWLCSLLGTPLSYANRTQATVTSSSAEAELMALFPGMAEPLRLQQLIEELQTGMGTTTFSYTNHNRSVLPSTQPALQLLA